MAQKKSEWPITRDLIQAFHQIRTREKTPIAISVSLSIWSKRQEIDCVNACRIRRAQSLLFSATATRASEMGMLLHADRTMVPGHIVELS
jgi:hypothetical protein